MFLTDTNRCLSKACYEKACERMPAGVSSPIRAFLGLGLDPLVVQKGVGDTLIDLDGNCFVDFCCSWGALIHGHAHPDVVQAACDQVANGSSFGLLTPLEEKLASQLLDHIPGADRLRFVSSGTEATMTALRLARGYTGKEGVIKFSGHYHGHVDSLLVQAGSGCLTLGATASSAGVPDSFTKLTSCIPFNDPDALIKALDQPNVAAIILEPIAANMGVVPPKEGFMQLLREETAKRGILLIFDEVITGFRVHQSGASAYFGIEPDLFTFGKVIGGGYNVAAVAGKLAIMNCLAPIGKVYQAGTLSGNPVAMAAGSKALELLDAPGFYEELESKTNLVTDPIRRLIQEKDLEAICNQVGSMFTLFLGKREVHSVEDMKACDATWYNRLFHFMFERGVYLSPLLCEANFVSMAHTDEHLTFVGNAICEFLDQ